MQHFQIAFCGYILLMRVFAATTIILPVLESTTYESSRRMILSTHVKMVKQTTSTLFLSLFKKRKKEIT